MALGAVALGFSVQGLTPQSSVSNGTFLLEALGEEKPASTPDTQVEAESLRGVQSQRLGLREPAAGRPLDLEIRVALLGAGSMPTLSADAPWQLISREGRVLLTGKARDPVPEVWSETLTEAWLVTAAGHLQVNGQPYAGRLRLVRDGTGVQLINHLPLELYVSSVVGAEMPSSWSMEALRAQAVAARSYALAHMARPASRHWHLGDTTRWQAYRGLASSNERTRQAVNGTAGLILSYQGGIVESLYAANREISLEAHGHLGASMSQHGAQALAQQGLTYTEILGRYYQGASLARLKAGAG
ncbi:MAG: SpoIID/LytB domain-containing protein [Cyanobacteriota bacterium]|nr:SpoIID/LytB domain-containing protein [Cyanobacteriota bacterium]